jgi:hypothetical protein
MRSNADQIVINQAGKEIELAIRRYKDGPEDPPLAWFIAERLADCRFIRSEAEMQCAENRSDLD